jgi:hypothetical protein
MITLQSPLQGTVDLGRELQQRFDGLLSSRRAITFVHACKIHLPSRSEQLNKSCRPIVTYNRRGVSKPGVIKSTHAVAFSSANEPLPELDEMPEVGEDPMLPGIQIRPASRKDKLDTRARIDFARMYTVEHNIKAYYFGDVTPAYMDRLKQQWVRMIFNDLSQLVGDESLGRPTRLPRRGDDDEDEDEDDESEEEEDEDDDDDDDDKGKVKSPGPGPGTGGGAGGQTTSGYSYGTSGSTYGYSNPSTGYSGTGGTGTGGGQYQGGQYSAGAGQYSTGEYTSGQYSAGQYGPQWPGSEGQTGYSASYGTSYGDYSKTSDKKTGSKGTGKSGRR